MLAPHPEEQLLTGGALAPVLEVAELHAEPCQLIGSLTACLQDKVRGKGKLYWYQKHQGPHTQNKAPTPTSVRILWWASTTSELVRSPGARVVIMAGRAWGHSWGGACLHCCTCSWWGVWADCPSAGRSA